MTITDGAIIAGLLTMGIGLVETVKALAARNGRRKNSVDLRKCEDVLRDNTHDHVEIKSAVLATHQQVQDRDGVPLSFHMREQIKISRAMLTQMEGLAKTQNDTAHILERLEKSR
jgi:hypothetical protein